MRSVGCFVFFLLLLGSCKTKNSLVNTGVLKSLSVKKIIKKNQVASFRAKTLEGKLKVSYSENRNEKQQQISFTVRLRIQKDSVIWIKGSYAFLNAFRARITPTSFSYYSLIDKSFFEGNFDFLEKIFGTKITFNQVQNGLLGESILSLKKQKYLSDVADSLYKLTPREQLKLYRIFLFFDPVSFKIKRQLLQLNGQTASIQIDYSNYMFYDSQLIPRKIEVMAKAEEGYTRLEIDFKSVILDKRISTPYRIPSNYKQIKF